MMADLSIDQRNTFQAHLKHHDIDYKKLSLIDKMRAKLSGGHFRMLNEQLYTTKGDEALHLVQQNPGVFDAYHEGFREQVKKWLKDDTVRKLREVLLRAKRGQEKNISIDDVDAELILTKIETNWSKEKKRDPEEDTDDIDIRMYIGMFRTAMEMLEESGAFRGSV